MDLEQKYGKRYRIFLDDSFKAEKEKNKTDHKWWYLELRGKGGYIYPYSFNELAVVVTGSIIANRVRRKYPWKIVQDADDVTVFLVPDSEAPAAISIIKPYRKVVLSEEEKAKIAARLKNGQNKKQNELSQNR